MGDVVEEAADIGSGEVARMAFVVEKDESARPVGEALARAVLAEVLPGGEAELIQQARRWGEEVGSGRRGHGANSWEKRLNGD